MMLFILLRLVGSCCAYELIALRMLAPNALITFVDSEASIIAFCNKLYNPCGNVRFVHTDASRSKFIDDVVCNPPLQYSYVLMLHPVLVEGNPAAAHFKRMLTEIVPRLVGLDGRVISAFYSKEESTTFGRVITGMPCYHRVKAGGLSLNLQSSTLNKYPFQRELLQPLYK